MDLTADTIARALRLGEDSRNEFKSCRGGGPHADAITAAIVAFANSGGGRLWLGVEDDGTVSGTGGRDEADRLLQKLDNVCQNGVVPPIACSHVKVEHDGKLLIVTDVPGYAPSRPYRTSGGRYFVRGGASRRDASPDEVRRLVLSAVVQAQVPDEMPVRGTSVADLDDTTFTAYHRLVYGTAPEVEAEARERLLINLRILSPEGLTLVGLLGFGRDPQRYLPWARVTAVRSPGTEVGLEMLDRKDFGGTIDAQIAEAEAFLLLHLASPVSIRGFDPERSRGVPTEHMLPLEAVREAVRNAVAHRDYAIPAQINLTLYDDRLEVVSPGRLLNSVTVEVLKLGAVHLERNPLVCTVLAKRGLMTERGSGVLRMMQLMRQHGLPEPEIEERGPSLIVTLRMRRAGP
jgi:ATP-dependent DNA helicase RecG